MSDFRENIGWLIQFYRPVRWRLIRIAALSMIVASISAAIPYIYIQIIDGIRASISYSFILRSIGILLVLGISNFFLSAFNASRRAGMNLHLEWQFRQLTFSKLIRMDQRFFELFSTGDTVTRLTDDVGRKLSWFACSGIFRAWESSLRTIFCLTAMFLINPWLSLIALLPFPVQIITYVKSVKVLDSRFLKLQQVISRVNETIEACFSGIKIVQAYCMETREILRFSQIASERAVTEVRAEKANIFVHSLYGYFWQSTQVLVLLAGGLMVISDKLTIGEFVAFDYYIAFLVWPMFDIGGLLVGYRRAAVSIRRLREIDSYQPHILNPDHPLTPDLQIGKVEFDAVTLKRNDRTILNSITFRIDQERMIAVVGGVGSGKSTFLDLICRILDPDQGTVRIDGIDLRNWDLHELRHLIGYVSQEPLLFTDTVRNNIRFGRSHISDQTIDQAVGIAQLSNEISHFAQGLDTPIGLRGFSVSGGQKQRISIARALVGKPKLLLLDDATSHLDAETESDLWTQLHKVMPEMKTFLVSHRTVTLERADRILVLKDGCLVETGSHLELMARNGEYVRIYSRQKLEECISRPVQNKA